MCYQYITSNALSMLLGGVVFAFCPCLYIVHMSLAQSNETLRSETIVQVFVPLVAQKPWRTWPTCANGGGTKRIQAYSTSDLNLQKGFHAWWADQVQYLLLSGDKLPLTGRLFSVLKKAALLCLTQVMSPTLS